MYLKVTKLNFFKNGPLGAAQPDLTQEWSNKVGGKDPNFLDGLFWWLDTGPWMSYFNALDFSSLLGKIKA